jgi:TolB-like protein
MGFVSRVQIILSAVFALTQTLSKYMRPRQSVYFLMACVFFAACYAPLSSSLIALPRQNVGTDSTQITVAVLNFKNNSGRFVFDDLEKSIPEMLKTELSRAPSRLLVVERSKLETILQEQALAQTGIIDEKTAQAVGKLAGAQYLLTGEISQVADSKLRVDCHILKVETGQVRGEKVIGPDREALQEMVRLLASNILFNLTGEGEYRASRRLKSYPANWFFLATGLTAVAAGLTHWASQDAYHQYQSASDLNDIDSDYDRANKLHHARNVLAITSGVLAITSATLWLKNHSAGNQILAAGTPQNSQPARELAILAGRGKIQIGLRMHF